MGSGILNIAAFGSQDTYLTGNPQMTFFKMVYRRHTNFAMEPLIVDTNIPIKFGSENSGGNVVNAIIKKKRRLNW